MCSAVNLIASFSGSWYELFSVFLGMSLPHSHFNKRSKCKGMKRTGNPTNLPTLQRQLLSRTGSLAQDPPADIFPKLLRMIHGQVMQGRAYIEPFTIRCTMGTCLTACRRLGKMCSHTLGRPCKLLYLEVPSQAFTQRDKPVKSDLDSGDAKTQCAIKLSTKCLCHSHNKVTQVRHLLRH